MSSFKDTLFGIAEPHFEHPSAWRSRRNILPLVLGVVVGFASYGVFFGIQMMALNNNVYSRHAEALNILKERLHVTMEEKKQSVEGASALTAKLVAAQEELSGLADLPEKYERLIADYNTEKHMVAQVTEENRVREQEFHEHSTIITQQRYDLERASQERDTLAKQVAKLKDEKRELKKKVAELQAPTSQFDALQERMRGRENFLCRQEYGDGPYYVQVTATVPDATPLIFIIELASRRDMPHTVYTFLSLVNYEMLDNSSMATAGDGILRVSVDGDSGTFATKRQAVGWAESPIIMFEEASPAFPCEEGSVKFDSAGPSLMLLLSSSQEAASCFGKIVKGVENVHAMQERLSSGNAMENIHFELLGV